jgi:hypothetical protein
VNDEELLAFTNAYFYMNGLQRVAATETVLGGDADACKETVMDVVTVGGEEELEQGGARKGRA